jgi:hypothetical protein
MTHAARGLRVAVACVALASLSACGGHGVSRGALPVIAPNDSLEGIVRVVGVEAMPETVLATDDGSRSLRLVGPDALRRVAGLRIAVIGLRDNQSFAVWRFVVVAANGVAASDGLLVARGDSLVLVTQRGALLVRAPSPGLRAALRHRVWISGPLDAPTVAYGIIE